MPSIHLCGRNFLSTVLTTGAIAWEQILSHFEEKASDRCINERTEQPVLTIMLIKALLFG